MNNREPPDTPRTAVEPPQYSSPSDGQPHLQTVTTKKLPPSGRGGGFHLHKSLSSKDSQLSSNPQSQHSPLFRSFGLSVENAKQVLQQSQRTASPSTRSDLDHNTQCSFSPSSSPCQTDSPQHDVPPDESNVTPAQLQ
jgi:hypothetical protein